MDNQITFNDKQGFSHTGEIVSVPGFEAIDFVFVQVGFFGCMYELATGLQVVTAQGCTMAEAIEEVKTAFTRKGVSAQGLLTKMLSNQHSFGIKAFEVINVSPAYEKFVAEQKQLREDLPFAFTEDQRAEIRQMIAAAQEKQIPENIITIFKAHLNAKADKSIKPTIEALRDNLAYNIKGAAQRRYRFNCLPLPKDLIPDDFSIQEISYEQAIAAININRKYPIHKYLPEWIIKEFYMLWATAKYRNNHYGYSRFTAYGWAELIRAAIDLKKERDVSDELVRLSLLYRETIVDISNGTQPYAISAHEEGYLKDFPDIVTVDRVGFQTVIKPKL